MRSSPIVVALATFAAYVMSGHELDAQTAFTSLSLFGIIGHPFHVLPKVWCSQTSEGRQNRMLEGRVQFRSFPYTSLRGMYAKCLFTLLLGVAWRGCAVRAT